MKKDKYVSYKFVNDGSLGDLDFKSNDYILNKIIKKALIQCRDSSNNNNIIKISTFNSFDILEAFHYYKLLYLNAYYDNYEILCLKDDYINNMFNQLQFRSSSLIEDMSSKELRNSLNNDENYFIKGVYKILVKSDKSITNKLLKLTNNNTVSVDKVNLEYIYLSDLEEEVKENN